MYFLVTLLAMSSGSFREPEITAKLPNKEFCEKIIYQWADQRGDFSIERNDELGITAKGTDDRGNVMILFCAADKVPN